MSERLAYQRKMEALLEEWPAKISFMESRAPTIATDKRAVYDGLLKLMREKLDENRRLLDASESAGEAGWTEAEPRLKRAWSDLANAYEKALCQFEGVKN